MDLLNTVPLLLLCLCMHILKTTAGVLSRDASFIPATGTTGAVKGTKKKIADCARECLQNLDQCSCLTVDKQNESEFCLLNQCDRNSSSIVYWKNDEKIPFLRRQDGSLDFNRGWADYKAGFGDLNGEYWMGLEQLHQLTSTENYGLFVEMIDGALCRFAVYDHFSIANEADLYRLNVRSYQAHSTAGDSIIINNGFGPIDGQQFSATDFGPKSIGCGQFYDCGWWFGDCWDACGTCRYDEPDPYMDGGVQWFTAFSDWRSFDYAEWSIIKFTR